MAYMTTPPARAHRSPRVRRAALACLAALVACAVAGFAVTTAGAVAAPESTGVTRVLMIGPWSGDLLPVTDDPANLGVALAAAVLGVVVVALGLVAGRLRVRPRAAHAARHARRARLPRALACAVAAVSVCLAAVLGLVGGAAIAAGTRSLEGEPAGSVPETITFNWAEGALTNQDPVISVTNDEEYHVRVKALEAQDRAEDGWRLVDAVTGAGQVALSLTPHGTDASASLADAKNGISLTGKSEWELDPKETLALDVVGAAQGRPDGWEHAASLAWTMEAMEWTDMRARIEIVPEGGLSPASILSALLPADAAGVAVAPTQGQTLRAVPQDAPYDGVDRFTFQWEASELGDEWLPVGEPTDDPELTVATALLVGKMLRVRIYDTNSAWWSVAPATSEPTQPVEARIYALSYFDEDGSTGLTEGDYPDGIPNPETYTSVTDTFTLLNPERTHYSFAGWTGEDPYGPAADSPSTAVTIARGSSGDRAYTAHWTPDAYTVDFDLNRSTDAVAPDSQAITYGNRATRPTDPYEKGWAFGGWYREVAPAPAADAHGYRPVDTRTAWDFDNLVEEDMTLHARWSARADTPYEVWHFLADETGSYGDTTDRAQAFKVDERVGVTGDETEAEALTAADYPELGSYEVQPFDQALIAAVDERDDPEMTVIVIRYARKAYTVNYHSNGHGAFTPSDPSEPGLYWSASNVVFGTDVPLPDVGIEEPGWAFGGWYPELDANATADEFGYTEVGGSEHTSGDGLKMPASPADGHIDFYAKWTASDTRLTVYYLTQDLVGSSVGDTYSMVPDADGGYGSTLAATTNAELSLATLGASPPQGINLAGFTYSKGFVDLADAQLAGAPAVSIPASGEAEGVRPRGDGSTKVYLFYTRNRYTVSYLWDQGTRGSVVSAAQSEELYFGQQSYTPPSSDVRVGYDLGKEVEGSPGTADASNAWNVSADGSDARNRYGAPAALKITDPDDQGVNDATKTLTLYAQWTPRRYYYAIDKNLPDDPRASTPTSTVKESWDVSLQDPAGSALYRDRYDSVPTSITIQGDPSVLATESGGYELARPTSGGTSQGSELSWNTSRNGTGTSYYDTTVAGEVGSPANLISEDKMRAGGPMPTVTLYARWKPVDFGVTLHTNYAASGGPITSRAEITKTHYVTYGDDSPGTTLADIVSKANIPTVPGYTLTRWYYPVLTTHTNVTMEADHVFKNITQSYDLYAEWGRHVLTVNYDAGAAGDASVANIPVSGTTYPYGDAQALTLGSGAMPTRNGYTFTGWRATDVRTGLNKPYAWNESIAASSTDASVTTIDSLIDAGDNVLTLTAQWRPNILTINYAGGGNDGGSAPVAANYTYGSASGVSVAGNSLTKTGHSFAGWKARVTRGTTVVATPTGSYASTADKVAAGSKVADDAQGVISAATANAWLADGDATLTLTADWVAHVTTISFSANGGSGTVPANIEVAYGQSAIIPSNEGNGSGGAILTLVGYKFGGWQADGLTYTTFDGVTNVYTKTSAADNETIMLSAVWTPLTYGIRFDANDSVGSTRVSDGDILESMCDLSYGTSYNLADKTYIGKRVGYTFKGWTYVKDGGSVDLTASDNVSNLIAKAGVTVEVDESGSKVAKTVGSDFAVTEDGATVVLYAMWTPITYKVKFDPGYGTQGGSGTIDDAVFTYDVEDTRIGDGMSRNAYNVDLYYLTTDSGITVRMTALWYFDGWKLDGKVYNKPYGTTVLEPHLLNLVDVADESVPVVAQWRGGVIPLTPLYDSSGTLGDFLGWYENPDFTGDSVGDGRTVTTYTPATEGVKLYARWEYPQFTPTT